MEDPDKDAELQRLINEAPVTPAKPSMLKNPTDPPIHDSFEDLVTGKWHHFLQTLHVTCRCASHLHLRHLFFNIIFFFIIFIHYLIAPGSATKLLQEESKQEIPKQEESKQEVPKEQTDMDLPLIYEEPIFKGKFMIYYDKEQDAVRLVKDTTVAIVGSVAITVKDVFRFSDTLELENPDAATGDQLLMMVACHTSEMRELFLKQILAFLNFQID
jgi:hypothetical protein